MVRVFRIADEAFVESRWALTASDVCLRPALVRVTGALGESVAQSFLGVSITLPLVRFPWGFCVDSRS